MGSLQESLNRFKKQQEKFASSEISTKTTTTAASTLIKSPVHALKFSDNIEKFQHINSIRKGTVGAQIKHVIRLLLRQVFESLAKNPKVSYDGKRFSYKSKYNVRDEKELLRLVRTFADLKDAYPTVMEDLQEAQKTARQIWLLSNFDSKEDIAYPNDPRIPIKVDDELKQLFRGIELPRDMLDMQKNGMKASTNIAKRRVMAQNGNVTGQPKQKKNKTEISKRTKLTNAHLPQLFKNLNC